MIEQILKFSKGGNSRQMLRDAEGAFRAAYANASEDARAQADALIQSASNYTSANPSVGRNNRLNQAEIYDEATRILKGEQSTVAPSISGGWGNRVINDFYSLNKKPAASTTTSTPSKKYTNYTDLNTDYFGIVDDNEDLKARVVRLATNIGNNLASAAKAKGEGSVVRGLDKISDITTLTNTMQNIAKQVENGTMDPRAAQAAILKYAPQLGITDKTAWDAYFGETDDLGEAEKNRNKLVSEGYKFLTETGNKALDAFVKSNNYNLATDKNNNAYIFDKNWNLVTGKGTVNMDEDYTGDNTEGMGFVLGDDGRYYTGNLFDLDQNHADYNKVQLYITDRIAANKKLGASSTAKYNHYLDMSEHDLINTFGGDLHDKQVVDVSGYFNGVPVVVTANDNNIDAHRSRLGHVNLQDSALTFYAMTPNGPKRGTYAEIVEALGGNGKVNIKGDSNKVLGLNGWTSFGGNLDNVQQKTEHLFTRLDANTYTGWKNWWTRNDKSAVTANKWENGHVNFDPDQDVSKAGGELAKQLIYWAATNDNELSKEAREIKSRWWRNQPEDALVVIREALRSNPGLFDGPAKSQYLNALKQILIKYKNYLKPASDPTEEINILLEKEGGILKAQKGAIVDAFGNIISGEGADPQKSIANKMRQQASREAKEENALRERAKEYGRTAHQQSQAEGGWKPQDTLRATALATDVAGLIAAISGAATGGVGSIAAIGTGVASTVMDTIADFSDDSISKGQAWKNLGINVGLTAGAAFGAKAPKILKSAIKLVPRIMMAAGTAGIVFDPEVHNTVKRMTEGKSMNIQDWRNIMMVLRMSTGIATAGTLARGVKKAAKRYEDAVDAKLKNIVTSLADENIAYVKSNADPEHPIALDKTVLKEVKSLLAKGKKDDAITLLSKSTDEGGGGLSASQVEDILSTTDNRGWKFWKSNELTTVEDAAAPTLRSKATPEQLAQAELEVMNAEQRRYNAMRSKHKFWAWADDHSLTGKLLGLDPSNSLIMTQALAVNGMTNKKGNFSALRAKKQGIVDNYNKELNLLAALDSSDPAVARADARAVGAELKNEVAPLNKKIKGREKAAVKADASIEKQQAAVDDIIQQKESVAAEIEALKNKKTPIDQLRRKELGVLMSRLNREQARLQQEITDAENTVNTFRNSSRKGIRSILQARKDYQDMLNFLKQHYNKPGYKQMIDYNPETGEYSITTRGSNKLAALKATLDNAVKVLDKAKKSQKSGYTQYEEAISAGRKARSKFKLNARVLDPNSSEQKELSRLIAEDKNFRATRDADLSTKQTELADLEAKLPTEQTALEGQIASRDKILGKKQALLDQRHSQANQKRLDAWASKGRDVWNSNKSITVTTSTGNVEVSAGTKIKSFAHLRNESLAADVAKHNKPDAVILTPAQIKQLLPKSAAAKVRGAVYDPTTKEISIWNQGGKIPSNFSHLRK